MREAETKVKVFSFTVLIPEMQRRHTVVLNKSWLNTDKQKVCVETKRTNVTTTHPLPAEITIWVIASSAVLQSPLGKQEENDVTAVISMISGGAWGPQQ